MWVPYIVVGMKYEVSRMTGAEELMLYCKLWTTRQNIPFRVPQMEYDECYKPERAKSSAAR
jgi:hypothetical protein